MVGLAFTPRPRYLELTLWTPSLDALPMAGISQPTSHGDMSPVWLTRETQPNKPDGELMGKGGLRQTFADVLSLNLSLPTRASDLEKDDGLWVRPVQLLGVAVLREDGGGSPSCLTFPRAGHPATCFSQIFI